MAAKQQHAGLWLAGGAAALAGYEFLLKPWLAAKNATPLGPFSPGPSLTTPPVVNPSGGGSASVVDPRVNPGGDVGQVMWRKGWTQAQATARLSEIKARAAEAVATLARLRAPGAVNAQTAALVSQGQNDLAQLQATATNDRLQQQNALAAGDTAAAAAWDAAARGHEQQVANLSARISATSAAGGAENQAQITAWESGLASLRSDYSALASPYTLNV